MKCVHMWSYELLVYVCSRCHSIGLWSDKVRNIVSVLDDDEEVA